MDVLLVEDNAGDAFLIRQILEENSIPVKLRIARDGEQALTMLSDGRFEPSLIILDLNLPRISGIMLLERWSSMATPVVVFSSTINESERTRVLELGAREFVQKPSDIDTFADVVCAMVERYAPHDGSTADGAGA